MPGLLLATRKPTGVLEDTFLMDVRHVEFPQLMIQSGTWTWQGDASSLFGGFFQSTVQNNYLETKEPITLQPGTYRIKYLGLTAANGGRGHVSIGGVDTLARLDSYTASSVYNNVVQDTFSVATKTSGLLRISVDSQDGASTGFRFRPSQFELVKISSESNLGTDLSDLPGVVDVPPFLYDNDSGSLTLTQKTNQAWGSYINAGATQNAWAEWKVWLPQGTFDLDVYGISSTNRGIAEFTLDGSTIGSQDWYSASGVFNVLKTITGINAPTTGIYTLRMTAVSKNASSSAFSLTPSWLQFRRTASATNPAPSGTTFGRETLELYPWFADSGDFDTFQLSSSYLHYGGYYNSAGAQFDSLTLQHSLKSGTYTLYQICRPASNRGIVHWSANGGAAQDTTDHYSPTNDNNIRKTASLSLAPGTLSGSMDTKNTSSLGYFAMFNAIRAVRTGA